MPDSILPTHNNHQSAQPNDNVSTMSQCISPSTKHKFQIGAASLGGLTAIGWGATKLAEIDATQQNLANQMGSVGRAIFDASGVANGRAASGVAIVAGSVALLYGGYKWCVGSKNNDVNQSDPIELQQQSRQSRDLPPLPTTVQLTTMEEGGRRGEIR